MQTKKTAPLDVSDNTKQNIHPTSSISDVISNYKDYSCASARPVPIAIGKHRAGLDFFFVILRITHLYQDKKYSNPLWTTKKRK